MSVERGTEAFLGLTVIKVTTLRRVLLTPFSSVLIFTKFVVLNLISYLTSFNSYFLCFIGIQISEITDSPYSVSSYYLCPLFPALGSRGRWGIMDHLRNSFRLQLNLPSFFFFFKSVYVIWYM